MKITLGLNAYHADSSASLFINNKLEIALEEERLNRIKHWSGFPELSINLCLQESKVNPSQITDVCVNTNPLSNIHKKIPFFFKNYLLGKKKNEIIDRLKNKYNIKKDLKKIGINCKIHYIDHHLSHLSSAFYASGYHKAAGLSIDGFGDFCSLTIAHCENSKIDIKKKIFFPHSLGIFFEAITQLIGFNGYGDEYKVMGLSSYGDPIYYEKIKHNVFLEDNLYKLNLKYFNHTNKNYIYNSTGMPKHDTLYTKKFLELFNITEETNLEERQKISIAASAQKIFEFYLQRIISEYKLDEISDKLVYAGGCALNSLANGKILLKNKFKEIFIPYSPGDSGGGIGAAIYHLKKEIKNEKIYNLQSPFIGVEFNDLYINNLLENIKTSIIYFKKILNDDALYEIVNNEIIKGNVIGWFQNKMEYGPRSLGNRAILADARNPNMKEIINVKIKRRESFRPFAPSILIEKKNEWFENNKTNNYMSFVEKIRPDKQKIIPAVTHVDGTGRVQTVSKETNKKFYGLINNFYKKTNVPILLNTSFNENEPIVMKPEDAIECFERTKMDMLVLNNFVVSKVK